MFFNCGSKQRKVHLVPTFGVKREFFDNFINISNLIYNWILGYPTKCRIQKREIKIEFVKFMMKMFKEEEIELGDESLKFEFQNFKE